MNDLKYLLSQKPQKSLGDWQKRDGFPQKSLTGQEGFGWSNSQKV